MPENNVWFSVAAFVPGGKYLAAAYNQDRDVYLWDVATGKTVRKFTGHVGLGISFAVSPDGKRLLSWSDDRTLRLWDVATGKELRRLVGHANRATGVFSADSKKVLTFSPDKTLRLWDVDTGKQLLKLEGHEDACTGSFSPDGKLALSFGTEGRVRLWNLETGKEIRRFERGIVKDGARGFIVGGRLVAAYCDDQKYRLWETASGKIVQEIDLSHVGGDRWSMTASPDGRLALVNHAGWIGACLQPGQPARRSTATRTVAKRGLFVHAGRQLRRGREFPRRPVCLPPAHGGTDETLRRQGPSRVRRQVWPGTGKSRPCREPLGLPPGPSNVQRRTAASSRRHSERLAYW